MMKKKLPSSSHLSKHAPPPFFGKGEGHNDMMDCSSKTTVARFLGQTHRSMSHHYHLWLYAEGILGLFQNLLESISTCWHNSTSAPHSAVRVQIWCQTMHVQTALNWHKWNSQNASNIMDTDSSVSKGKSLHLICTFICLLFDGGPKCLGIVNRSYATSELGITIQTLCSSQCIYFLMAGTLIVYHRPLWPIKVKYWNYTINTTQKEKKKT